MQLLPVYIRKKSYKERNSLALRILLPIKMQNPTGEVIKLLRNDGPKMGKLFLNVMTADYINESIRLGRWVTYKELI